MDYLNKISELAIALAERGEFTQGKLHSVDSFCTMVSKSSKDSFHVDHSILYAPSVSVHVYMGAVTNISMNYCNSDKDMRVIAERLESVLIGRIGCE